MLLAANPRLQLVTVATPFDTEHIRVMLLDRDDAGLRARVDDVAICANLTYGDIIRVREDSDALQYVETLERSDYNAWVALAARNDTRIGPRLAALDCVAERILRTSHGAIVSAAPPRTRQSLECLLAQLVEEGTLRELVHTIAR